MSTFQTYSPLLSLETKRKNEEKKMLESISLDKRIKKRDLNMNHIKKIKAQSFVKEFKERKRELIEEMRISRRMKRFYVPMKPSIIFAIRIKGINGIPPKAKKILELLRLKKLNNGIFLKLNPQQYAANTDISRFFT